MSINDTRTLDRVTKNFDEITVDSVSTLRGSSFPANVQRLYLLGRNITGDGGQGDFVWDASDLSTEVGSDPDGWRYVAPGSAPDGSNGAWVRLENYESSPTYNAVSLYVDNGGDDANSGTLPSSPLATVLEAIKRIPRHTGVVDTTVSNGQYVIVPDVSIILTSGQSFEASEIRIAAPYLSGLEITTTGSGKANLQIPAGEIGFLPDATRVVFDNVVVESVDTNNKHRVGIQPVNGAFVRTNSNCILRNGTDFDISAYRGAIIRPGGTFVGNGKGMGTAISVHSAAYVVNGDNSETNISGYNVAVSHDRASTSDIRGTVDDCSIAISAEDGADAKDIGMDITNCDIVYRSIRSGSISIVDKGVRTGNLKEFEVIRGGSIYDNTEGKFYSSGTSLARGTFYNSAFDVNPDESVAENPGIMSFGRNTDKGGMTYRFHRGDGTTENDFEIGTSGDPYIRFLQNASDSSLPNDSLGKGAFSLKYKNGNGDLGFVPVTNEVTGGDTSASGHLEITVNNTTYKVLISGTV